MDNILSRLKQARKAAKISQEDLGKRLNPQCDISRIESGTRRLRVDTLLEICQILAVCPNWILTGKEAEPEPELKPVLLVAGNLCDGFRFIGPFSKDIQAKEFCKQAGIKRWQTLKLIDPSAAFSEFEENRP